MAELKQLAEQHFEAIRQNALMANNNVGDTMMSGTLNGDGVRFGDPENWHEKKIGDPRSFVEMRAVAEKDLHTFDWVSREKTARSRASYTTSPKDASDSVAYPSAIEKVHALATLGLIVFAPFTGEFAVVVPKVTVDAERIERFSRGLQDYAEYQFNQGQDGDPAYFDKYLEEFLSFEIQTFKIEGWTQPEETPIAETVKKTLLGDIKSRAAKLAKRLFT